MYDMILYITKAGFTKPMHPHQQQNNTTKYNIPAKNQQTKGQLASGSNITFKLFQNLSSLLSKKQLNQSPRQLLEDFSMNQLPYI